jgi:hypothetical protein
MLASVEFTARTRRVVAGVVSAAAVLLTVGAAPVGDGQSLGAPLPLPTSLAVIPGNVTDYALSIYGGIVERWNPCQPIPYRTDTKLVGEQAVAQVQAAIDQLSYVTGLQFVYQGDTDFTPQLGHRTQPAPLVISFSRPKDQPDGSGYLDGGLQLGYGGFVSQFTSVRGKVTSDRIKLGFAVIDAEQYQKLPAKVQLSLLLHELGHAVGLNHASNPAELMYPVVSGDSPAGYAAGDIRGLVQVGATTACALK